MTFSRHALKGVNRLSSSVRKGAKTFPSFALNGVKKIRKSTYGPVIGGSLLTVSAITGIVLVCKRITDKLDMSVGLDEYEALCNGYGSLQDDNDRQAREIDSLLLENTKLRSFILDKFGNDDVVDVLIEAHYDKKNSEAVSELLLTEYDSPCFFDLGTMPLSEVSAVIKESCPVEMAVAAQGAPDDVVRALRAGMSDDCVAEFNSLLERQKCATSSQIRVARAALTHIIRLLNETPNNI